MQPQNETRPGPEAAFKPDQIKDAYGKFDLNTHVFNARGTLHHVNAYRRYVDAGRISNERPVGSGNLWDDSGDACGRVTVKRNAKGIIQSKVFDYEAEHVTYTRPLSVSEQMQAEQDALKARNEQLEAELASIKAEAAAKLAPAPAGMVPNKPAVREAGGLGAVAPKPALDAKSAVNLPPVVPPTLESPVKEGIDGPRK